MKIFVKAKPMARKESVEKIDDANFVVCVRELPKDGEANKAIIRVLSEYFGVGQQNVKIIAGHSSKRKIIIINQ